MQKTSDAAGTAGDSYALVMKTGPAWSDLARVRRPLGAPGPGSALVKIHRAAVCGTDLHILKWNDWAQQHYRLPLPLGHEFSGVIAAIGADDAPAHHGLAVGDSVTVETHLACGHCDQCLRDRGHTCLNLKVFTRLGEGAFAEYATVPLAMLRRLPAGMSHRHGCLLEPLGIALRAVEECRVTGGVLFVSGCGPIGLLAVAAARETGVARVLAADLSPARRELALALGAEAAVDPRDGSDRALVNTGVDGVVEASGSPAAIENALNLLRPGGTLMLAGIPAQNLALDLSRHVVLREIAIRGVYGRHLQGTWARLQEIAPRMQSALDRLITHEFAQDDFAEAFRVAMSGQAGKVELIFS
ncbi:alcohol dehydrogenase catalytic domain-containing protein [Pseudacidovorax sp. RU35E]|uniref:zinc-binding dehydrogenase n=1 Tax=Pseudacidovorax sp. RU35E TaxID=1907403 RepID=UPI0009541F73|nr:alcohol dehydrogenase catalytic domain-containing protein [Pseudacidovorax sp. RU35E]SIR51749.1 L-threonine 3-dehydrogenase [Pseudacidovorax sp. RU35E]